MDTETEARQDEAAYLRCQVQLLTDEVQRLRLSEEEQTAVRFCVAASLPETQKLGGVAGELCRMHAATLRGTLERMGGGE